MKCRDCIMDCGYRTSDGEKECEFQNHVIQLPDEWQGIRIQAAIAAMQGLIMSNTPDVLDKGTPKASREYLAKTSVQIADTLIKELRKEK